MKGAVSGAGEAVKDAVTGVTEGVKRRGLGGRPGRRRNRQRRRLTGVTEGVGKTLKGIFGIERARAMKTRTRHLAHLRQLGGADDRDIDIAHAALALAALDLPDTEISPYRRHVDALASGVAEAAPGGGDLGARIAAVHRIVFVRHAYRGDTKSYDDVQNANLVRVIDRRRGLPVALGILCIHAARAQGWEIAGLNFPAHFLLRITASHESAIIDPFDGARILEADDLGAFTRISSGNQAASIPRGSRSWATATCCCVCRTTSRSARSATGAPGAPSRSWSPWSPSLPRTGRCAGSSRPCSSNRDT